MNVRKQSSGITLIALVVTIIVMLILVGVTVTVALNGGLFSTAKTASLDTRAEIVREKVEEWKAIKEADKYTNDKKAQTLEELINDLVNKQLLTNEERDQILGNVEKNIEAKGEVTIGSRRIVFRYLEIGTSVSVGDFVDYKAGNWTNEDIRKLGDYYEGKTLPVSKSYRFGGFEVGDSKDSTVNADPWGGKNNYESGWRVLNKNEDGSIDIIHAGTSEGYRQGYEENGAYKNQWILGGGKNKSDTSNITDGIVPRDWSMYEDDKYAKKKSARTISEKESNILKNNRSLFATGTCYYLASAGNSKMMVYHDKYGTTYANQYWDAPMGIRPVVTIKSEVSVDPNGNEKHTTPETAWKLILE